MPRFAFAGYYGMSNFGDDLFGAAAVLGSSEYWPMATPRIVAPRLERFPSDRVACLLSARAYQGDGFIGKGCRALAYAAAASACDKFVFAGGSVFHSARYGATDLACLIRRNSCSAIGVSIGPFKNRHAENHIRRLLKRFEYIAVRDQASHDVAASFSLDAKLVRSVDLAGILPLHFKQQIAVRSGVIGISPCSSARNSNEFREEFVRYVRSRRKYEDISVCVLRLNGHRSVGDQEECGKIKSELSRAGIPFNFASSTELGIQRTWELIGSFSCYFTSRLHGGISAYLTGRPFVLAEYHPKCTEFLDSIGLPSEMRWNKGGGIPQQIHDLKESAGLLSVGAYVEEAKKNFTEAPWFVEQLPR